jgi:hypothetical protein
MDPNVLTVFKSPFPKIRLGKDNDGGYVICDIPNVKYEILITGGVDDDISFEKDFTNRYNTKCIAFDGTVNLNEKNENILFVKKNISYVNGENETNLHDLINENKNIFIKMDIEGWEIPWIKSLSLDQMSKFEQIVMEFHDPYSHREIEVFDKLNTTHFLVHFHGNNGCGTRNHRNVIMPNVFECTYLNKKYFLDSVDLNTDKIPSVLDMKNILKNEEIFITYPPFVHK